MHETLTTEFKGKIDKIETINGNVIVTGWAANYSNTPVTSIIVTRTDGSIVNATIEPIVRTDVYEFYDRPNDTFINSGFKITFPIQVVDVVIRLNGFPTFNIPGNKFAFANLDDVIQHNPNTKPELIVVDNFYKDPDLVREYALAQEFKANELYHKGARTQRSYIPSWTQAEFSRLLNKEVTAFVGATGVFQYCVAKDNVVYHYDTQEYAAMVYLSPDAPLQTGTQTYRSKLTGLFGAATDADAARLGKSKEEIDTLSFNGNNFYDRHNMELVDSVANVYNRMVIFNARALHAATSYYGSTKENARLFHLYFFNC